MEESLWAYKLEVEERERIGLPSHLRLQHLNAGIVPGLCCDVLDKDTEGAKNAARLEEMCEALGLVPSTPRLRNLSLSCLRPGSPLELSFSV